LNDRHTHKFDNLTTRKLIMSSSNSFTIDDSDPEAGPPEIVVEDQQTADDLIIEELPEDDEEQVHDQLPSVEEAKANLAHKPSSNNRKKIYLLVAAVLAVVVITVSAIVIANNKNKNKAPISYSPTGRAAEVIQFLWDNKVSALPTLQDPSFPQHLAAMFVADGDLYQMQLTEENAEKFVERYVLSLLYYSLSGADWNYQLKFLSSRDHCEWNQRFTTPSGKTLLEGVVCNEDGYVKELNLGKQQQLPMAPILYIRHSPSQFLICNFRV
jgi:hypothetical protein